jgi:hypothetical protein
MEVEKLAHSLLNVRCGRKSAENIIESPEVKE